MSSTPHSVTTTIVKTANARGTASVSVYGATGYAGCELVRLLVAHPDVHLQFVGSQTYAGQKLSSVFPSLNGQCDLTCSDNRDLAGLLTDVAFFACPPGVAASQLKPHHLDNCRIIDLSADFRLKNIEIIEQWYGTKAAADAGLLGESVYGLTELNKSTIAGARLIANPGCYATATLLALAPLVKSGLIETKGIIVDGKSGVSGAGRTASLALHYNEVNESIKTYKAPHHRHIPEIEQLLASLGNEDVTMTFAAHLVPMNRGLLVTAYASLKPAVSSHDIQSAYADHYANEPFIRLIGSENNFPETRWVTGTNFCDIGFAIDERCNKIVVVSALDNLIKGAAGQAIQNMNLMLGLPETAGLGQHKVIVKSPHQMQYQTTSPGKHSGYSQSQAV